MAWVWENSASSGAARLVLLAIADAANDTGREAYPGMATIAAKANLDKRTAQRAIRSLVDLGELSVFANAGPNGTHRYAVNMSKGRQDATPAGCHGGDTPPGDMPPRQVATVASDPSGGGISSLRGRQDATRTILEPSKNRPSSSKPPELRRDSDPRFVEFWSVYPKRVGKADALKALAKALKDGASIDEIIKGAKQYRDDPNRNNEYTAHPATWLRAGRWADELIVTNSPKAARPAGWEFGMN